MLPCLFALLGATSSSKIGLAINVTTGGGLSELMTSVRRQIRLGLQATTISLKWDEYEAQHGKPLDDALGGMFMTGQQPLLTISTLDTVKRRLPADVINEAWDSPLFLKRFDAFIDEIGPKIKGKVPWVSLGNEVDGYLSSHPDEIAAYKRFMAHERQHLKQIDPAIKVGVTVMWGGTVEHPDVVAAVQENTDIAVFTYYPTQNMKGLPIAKVPTHFATMLKIAANRPLLLQEIGYPSSAECGSSEATQAQFVHEVFEQMSQHGLQIPLGSFFLESDCTGAQLDLFTGYYGLSNTTFREFLRTLGLRRADGTPKPAWNTFVQEMKVRYPIDAGS